MSFNLEVTMGVNINVNIGINMGAHWCGNVVKHEYAGLLRQLKKLIVQFERCLITNSKETAAKNAITSHTF